MEGKNKLPTTRLTPLPLPTQHASLSLSAQKEEQSLGTGLHKRSQSQQYSPGRRQQNPQAIQPAPSESGSTLEANLRAKPGIAPRATVSGGSIASHGQQSLSRSAWRCPAARLDSRRSNVVPPGRGSRAAPAEGGLGPGATRLGTALSPPPPARQHRGDGTPGVCEGRRHVPSPREMESGGGGVAGRGESAETQLPPPDNGRPFPVRTGGERGKAGGGGKGRRSRSAWASEARTPPSVETGFGWQARRAAVPPPPRPSRRLMGMRVPAGPSPAERAEGWRLQLPGCRAATRRRAGRLPRRRLCRGGAAVQRWRRERGWRAPPNGRPRLFPPF